MLFLDLYLSINFYLVLVQFSLTCTIVDLLFNWVVSLAPGKNEAVANLFMRLRCNFLI